MFNEEERQLIIFFEYQNIPKDAYRFHPCGKNHPPDAQARVGNCLVSIEHTRLTKQRQRKHTALRKRILDKCKQLCDWKKYSVKVLFKPGVLHYYKIRSIAEGISNILNIHLKSIGQDIVRIESSSVILSVRLSAEFEINKWISVEDSCGWVSQTNDAFTERIAVKEKHISRHCNDYDNYWLLICYDRYKTHGLFELDLTTPITTSFDKVFVISERGIAEVMQS